MFRSTTHIINQALRRSASLAVRHSAYLIGRQRLRAESHRVSTARVGTTIRNALLVLGWGVPVLDVAALLASQDVEGGNGACAGRDDGLAPGGPD